MSELVEGVELVDMIDSGLWFHARCTGDWDRGVDPGVCCGGMLYICTVGGRPCVMFM